MLKPKKFMSLSRPLRVLSDVLDYIQQIHNQSEINDIPEEPIRNLGLLLLLFEFNNL